MASPVAFGTTGLPFFVDEAPQGAFAVFCSPSSGTIPAKEQFSGVPCEGSSLATGPTGNFYVVQYCLVCTRVRRRRRRTGRLRSQSRPTPGQPNRRRPPTYATVDPEGDL